MHRFSLQAAIFLLGICGTACGQDIPRNVKLGASFIWELTRISDDTTPTAHLNGETQDRLGVKLKFDAQAIRELNKIVKSIQAMRRSEGLANHVFAVNEKTIAFDQGNKYNTYRIDTIDGDLMYVELHLRGTATITIDGIKLLQKEDGNTFPPEKRYKFSPPFLNDETEFIVNE